MQDRKITSFCCDAPVVSNDTTGDELCPACGEKQSEHYNKCSKCGKGVCVVSTELQRQLRDQERPKSEPGKKN